MPHILSSNKKHQLHHTFYQPTGEVKAALLILHGMCEHSGRYDTFARYLQSQGIAVLTYDHLGHGKTVHSADELGYWGYAARQYLEQDALLMANQLRARHANVPHFSMGHSMGSFILRNILTQHSDQFTGAVIMGTSHRDPLLKLLIPLFGLLSRIAPKKRAVWAAHLSGNILNRKLKDKATQTNKSWLSANVENIQHFKADPLCNFVFTNSAYHELFRFMDSAINQPWFQPIDRAFPMLFTSGQDDPLGDMGKGIDDLVKQLESDNFSALDKLLFPNMRHEPLYEKDNQSVFEDIAQWITKQAGID